MILISNIDPTMIASGTATDTRYSITSFKMPMKSSFKLDSDVVFSPNDDTTLIDESRERDVVVGSVETLTIWGVSVVNDIVVLSGFISNVSRKLANDFA